MFLLDLCFSFGGAGGIETDGGGVSVTVEGGAAIAGISGHNALYRGGSWPCSGRLNVVVLYFVLSLLAHFAFWSRIVSGLNQERA